MILFQCRPRITRTGGGGKKGHEIASGYFPKDSPKQKKEGKLGGKNLHVCRAIQGEGKGKKTKCTGWAKTTKGPPDQI